MKKIDLMLEKEGKRILSLNDYDKISGSTKVLLDEINLFILDLLNKNVDLQELEENFLTPTLVFIGKIEALHKSVKKSGIKQVVLKLDLILLSFSELFDYYEFEADEESLDADLGITTSLFNNMFKSSRIDGIFMLHQELYEHEDDTDDSNYFLIIKGK